MKLGFKIKIVALCALMVCFCIGGMGAKTYSISALTSENVSVFGTVIGMSLDSDGLLVVGNGEVETADGLVSTTTRSDIRKGDIVIKLGELKIISVTDVENALRTHQGKHINIKLKRKDKTISTVISPAVDKQSGMYKLGLWVKDHVSGIGTLTFATAEGRFGALGHGVTGLDVNGEAMGVSGGTLFPCEVLGVKKGVRGRAGSIQGTFSYRSLALAEVKENNIFGLNGVLENKISLESEVVSFGGRKKAHTGKAEIINNFSGKRERYAIEIERATHQDKPQEKSMTIHVTDEHLIALTGGIVQGMSGSPIIQDGYLIGAVTHVLNSDPTKGYGVYADWML